jgi:hypothetical protein
MSRRILVTLALIAICGTVTAIGQEPGKTGIMYGPGHAYMVEAPDGWVLDNQVGRSRGLHAIFYRIGETWRDTDAFMYVNTAAPDSGEAASAEAVARRDSLRFVAQNPNIKITVAAPIEMKDGTQAMVRHFTGDVYGNSEAAAYVPEKTFTPIFILSATSEDAFKQALPAFEQLVRSYALVGTDVNDVKIPPLITGLSNRPLNLTPAERGHSTAVANSSRCRLSAGR